MDNKALVFDLDGTLVNTLADIAASVNVALDFFNLPQHSEEAICKMIGKGAKNLIFNALPEEKRDDVFLEKVLAFYNDYYDKHLVVNTYVYPGMSEVLTELKKQGKALFILSNKNDRQVKEIAGTLLPDIFTSVNGFSPDFPHKPSPDALLDIIGRFGFAADDTMIIGDSAVDVQTAVNANIKSVGVTWGFGGKTSFERIHPDFVAEDSKQLYNILKK